MQNNLFDDIFSPTKEKTVRNTVFYHMYCINDAINRFDRTYRKIRASGLLNNIDMIFVNCVGPNSSLCYDKIKFYDKINIKIGSNHKNESETLNKLRNFCIHNPQGNILYLHSKGVSRAFNANTNSLSIQDWIDYMEYFLIENYNECLLYLNSFDSVGVNQKINNRGNVRYSGNFWWAKNSYISLVPKCLNRKLYCELEFLSNKSKKHKCLYRSSVGWPQWKTQRYPRYLYTDKKEII